MMNKKSMAQQTGFGSAENKDQEQFDLEQESLTSEQLDSQVDELVALFRRKQQESSTR
jgi:hypothetical protein